jgi:UDP-N-acetylmuramate dehydrogenase
MVFASETTYALLSTRFGTRVRKDEPMARHSTFGVGGPADVWISVETGEQLLALVELCAQQRWPLLITGNGTNVLYADAGVRGIVAHVGITAYTLQEQPDGTAFLEAGAGLSWPRLLNDLAPRGWGGLEFGPGIPGTMGGAVISNAGVHGHDIGEVLAWVDVIDARNAEEHGAVPVLVRYQHDELELRYRHSRFRSQRLIQFADDGYPIAAPRGLIEPAEIVVQVGLQLHRAEPTALRAAIDEHKQYRKNTQPPQQSAGSIFKNPSGDYAGRLIESAGLKGLTRGGAQISQRHANFIVNVGGASAADIAVLIQEAHQRVFERFGVSLELEVELRGEWN